MENLENQCLEKLNKILYRFKLKVIIINVKMLNQCQHRLIYKNNNDYCIASWLSLSDMLFTRTTSGYMTNSIYGCLKTYYVIISNQAVNPLGMNKDTLSRFQACSDAYKEIICLASCSFEELLIKCDLMGI